MKRMIVAGAVVAALAIPSLSTAATFPVRLVSQNNNTLTLGWDPQPGYGYLFSAAGTVVSRTYDPARTTVRFSKGATSYDIDVIAKGANGHYPPPAQGPSAPTSVTVTSVTQTGMTVVWSAVTGAMNYRIYRAGVQIGEGPGSSGGYTDAWADSGLTCGTSYVYAVDAQNADGNSAKTSVTGTTLPCSPPPPPPPPPTGNVLEISGTVTASTLDSRIAAAPAGALTIRPVVGQASFTVTGTWTPSRQNLSVQHGAFTTIRMRSGGSGLTVEDSTARDFQVDGGNNWTLNRDSFDGSCVPQNFLYRSSGWKVLNSTFKNYYACSGSTHSEAFFIGAGAHDGLIQGNHFDNNGTTGHLFFTWFDQGGSGAQNPHDICVTGNTFTRSRNGYFSIQFRSELPDTLRIWIDPNNVSDTTLFGNESGTHNAWVRAC